MSPTFNPPVLEAPRGEGREPGGRPGSETAAPALRGGGPFVTDEEGTFLSCSCISRQLILHDL